MEEIINGIQSDEVDGEIGIDEDWNDDIIEDIQLANYKSIIVYSRDWTIQTIYNQIEQGNIDLNPKFQRRNAWNDEKRSRLIESLVLGLPIPEIVLAEHPTKRKSFIVIDGKQRLLTIAGFINPKKIPYWKGTKLIHLKQRVDLNGKSFEDLKGEPYDDVLREFNNADMRCTVISNYQDNDVLYDIFYRLNTGSVPLSTQELRQVLHKGSFADYLFEITDDYQLLHKVMGIKGSDPRLRDMEILLRFISFWFYGKEYRGNLKSFLDSSMARITKDWELTRPKIEEVYADFKRSLVKLADVFHIENIGRKYTNGKFEARFNKVLLEVQVYYFSFISNEELTEENKENLRLNFQHLCQDANFRTTIESSTKNAIPYQIRYELFRDYINKTLKKDIEEIPVPIDR